MKHQKYFLLIALTFTMLVFIDTCLLSTAKADSSTPVLKNGNFALWQKGTPQYWKLSKGALFNGDAIMAYEGEQSLRMELTKTDASLISARIYQDVQLKSNHEYSIRLMVAQQGTGTLAVRVQPLEKGKIARSISAPLDWKNWTREFPWTPLLLKFTTGADRNYRITIQNYGHVGEKLWIDQVKIRHLSDAEQETNKDHFAYTQSIMMPFSEKGISDDSQITEHLFVTGTKSTFVPAFLGFHTVSDLQQVQIKWAMPPTNKKGEIIPLDEVQLKMVGEQSLLPPSAPRSVSKGHNLGWWIITHIPKNISSGIYRGRLVIQANDQLLKSIAYTLRIENYLLPEVNIPFFVYHSEYYFSKPQFLTDQLREMYYRDMKNHGMNTVTVYNTPDIDGKNIDFNHDYRYSALTTEQRKEYLQKSKIDEAQLKLHEDLGLNQMMQLIKISGLVAAGMPDIWLPMKSGQYSWGDMPAEALEKSLEKWRRNSDWPEPLLYVSDEPYGYPDRIAAAKKALEKIHHLKTPVKTTTAYLPVDELGAKYDVWIQAEYMINPEMAASAQRLGKDLWVYNCTMPVDNAPFTRAYYGFWGYRSQVKGIGLWAYYDSRGWYMDARGNIHGDNGIARLSRICPSPNGPVPTISWETTREGTIDYRYAMLFDHLLEKLKIKADRQKTPEIENLLATVKNVRRKTIDSIPFDAMAVKADLRWTSDNAHFVPTLGTGDQRLISEHKRKVLRAYIRLMLAELNVDQK